ncbi:hypothetical protein [Segetibacter aerophilus]|uniref:hypothetical protein n=1 Tax=Segetibacter aerophilus TaxID=670293 RepID=UPI0011BFC781|nr:hypothetical protein [Segetibacter aerophilus]
METGLHQSLLDNPSGWIVFDVLFYSMPLLYLLAFKKNVRVASAVAVVMMIVNFIYIQCYTLYPTSSIEGFIAWLLFPFLLMCTELRSFYFILHALRYFFLFFFASAAAWKFVQGGIFSIEQMSGILLFQHKEYLASSPHSWYASFIYWLISHTYISYSLYLAATILELSFAIGFFTKKYDCFLIIASIIFLLTDVFFMRIPYWEVTPFLLTLLFSKYHLPQPTKSLAVS